jgi:hypothetical protein
MTDKQQEKLNDLYNRLATLNHRVMKDEPEKTATALKIVVNCGLTVSNVRQWGIAIIGDLCDPETGDTLDSVILVPHAFD